MLENFRVQVVLCQVIAVWLCRYHIDGQGSIDTLENGQIKYPFRIVAVVRYFKIVAVKGRFGWVRYFGKCN